MDNQYLDAAYTKSYFYASIRQTMVGGLFKMTLLSGK